MIVPVMDALEEVSKGQFTKPALALDTQLGSSEIASE